MAAKQVTNHYQASEKKVLEGLEPVRKGQACTLVPPINAACITWQKKY
jgi:hypothetical protein